MRNRAVLLASIFAFFEVAQSQFGFPLFGNMQNYQSNFNPQQQGGFQQPNQGFGFQQPNQGFYFPQQNFGFMYPNYNQQNQRPNQPNQNRPNNNFNQQNYRPPQQQTQRPTTPLRPVVNNPPATQQTQPQTVRPIATTASPLSVSANFRISQKSKFALRKLKTNSQKTCAR